MSADSSRETWNQRHRGHGPGAVEPFFAEVLPLLSHSGLALDIAAGHGRHSIALARHGLHVIAVDYSQDALRSLAETVQGQKLTIWPVVADLDNFSIAEQRFDLIVNINFLDRSLFPRLVRGLVPGGKVLASTFLVDQASIGHPRNPNFLLQHGELRTMLDGLDVLRYDEALVVYPDNSRAWRASALAQRKGNQ